jgi:hypothetical protein
LPPAEQTATCSRDTRNGNGIIFTINEWEWAFRGRTLLPLLKALCTIQRFAATVILLPEHLDPDEVAEWISLPDFLSSDPMSVDPRELMIDEWIPLADGYDGDTNVSVQLLTPVTTRVGGQTVFLGGYELVIHLVELVNEDNQPGSRQGCFRPSRNSTATLRFQPNLSSQARQCLAGGEDYATIVDSSIARGAC